MEPFTKATDPASDRLTRDQVISIHRQHREGRAWDLIASTHGTTRKNVRRILDGVRWRDLHPEVSPELYAEPEPTPRKPDAVIINALDEIQRQLATLRAYVELG